MELRQLQYFLAVAQEMHFGRAAELLRISQPPLSLHIKRLERELDVQLFTRSTRKVALTAAGEVFRDRVQQILRDLDEAVAETAETRDGRRGRVRVGFVSSANYATLPAAVRHFRSMHPHVQLDLRPLTSAEQIEQLLEGALDVGLLRDPDPNISLRYSNLLTEELVAVIPDNHPLARQKILDPGDLIDEPMILFPYATMPGFVATVLGIFSGENRMPTIVQQAIHQETIMGLVSAGMGFSILPESVSTMQIGGVQTVPINSAQRTELMLAEPMTAGDSAAADFAQCLKTFPHRPSH